MDVSMVGPKKIITILLLTDQNHALWRKRLSQIRYNVFADEQLVAGLAPAGSAGGTG
jgi:hypothetical protein